MGCGKSKPTTVLNGDVCRVRDNISIYREEEIITEEAPSESPLPLPLQDEEEAVIDQSDHYQTFFIEFPTPHLLREANRNYGQSREPERRDPDGQLRPFPTSASKASVFNEKEYTKVDLFATEVDCSRYTQNLETFTKYLTAAYTDDQMSTARIIFRWLAGQDINQLEDISSNADSVLWHLNKLKNNSGYYPLLYIEMCKSAGLQCQLIQGYVKHAHLEVGEVLTAEEINGWVAVVINNQWRLVDPCWGSSHMTGEYAGDWLLIDDNGRGRKDVPKQNEETVYSCNEVYFLTDPEEFIYSHIPSNDESLQFLARPVTLGEFTEMAYLKPAFFDLDLRLLEHRKCTLHASEGEIDFKIGIAPGRRISFIYQLWMARSLEADDITSDRFCFMQQRDGVLFCRILFPKPGKFRLHLYARDADKADSSLFCQLVCKFIIHCDKPAEGARPLPENVRREWGPGPDMEAAGLMAVSHEDALIESEDGTLEIRLRAKQHVHILHQLHSNDKDKDQLRRQIIHYKDDSGNEGDIVLLIRLPDVGDYALNLFANTSRDAESKFTNVCSYILTTGVPAADRSPYPDLVNGRIGSLTTRTGTDIFLKLTSHPSPLITCCQADDLILKFESSIPVDSITYLERCDGEETTVMDNLVWIRYESPQLVTYRIRLPECGTYVLKLLAREAGFDRDFLHVYTCLLDVTMPTEVCAPFPTKFLQWKSDCKILEPTVKVLSADTVMEFAVCVPDAFSMTVINSDNVWTKLDRGADDVWQGQIPSGNPGQLSICAQLEEDSNNYSTMLQYEVASQEELQTEQMKQQKVQEEAKKTKDLKQEEEKKDKEERIEMFEKCKQELIDALKERDLSRLRKALKAAERNKYVGRLQDLVSEAKQLISSLQRIHTLKQAILKLDQNTMLEIKNYHNPPKGVHEVMISTLLILGDPENTTKVWSDCQKCLVTIGRDGLYKRVTKFDLKLLNQEIAARALYIIGKFRVDDISVLSAGAAVFYRWTTGMIKELYYTHPDAKKATPANISRQNQIFDALKPRNSIIYERRGSSKPGHRNSIKSEHRNSIKP